VHHAPAVRPRPLRWSEDEPPTVVAYGPGWEVTCTTCGDDLGPVERQTPHVQKLRGPFTTVEEAAAAVLDHEEAPSSLTG
jgi:hypothetical protein